jgi:Low molecular weight phosphotyrosine protein phosphatase
MCDGFQPPSGADDDSIASGDSRDDELTVGDALRAWSRARGAGRTPGRGAPKKTTIGVLFVGKDNSSVTVAAEAIFSDMVARRASPTVRIFCHSAGTRVRMEGAAPDPMFIEGLRFKRGLDVSSHAASSVSVTDLETYDLIVCTGMSLSSSSDIEVPCIVGYSHLETDTHAFLSNILLLLQMRQRVPSYCT